MATAEAKKSSTFFNLNLFLTALTRETGNIIKVSLTERMMPHLIPTHSAIHMLEVAAELKDGGKIEYAGYCEAVKGSAATLPPSGRLALQSIERVCELYNITLTMKETAE